MKLRKTTSAVELWRGESALQPGAEIMMIASGLWNPSNNRKTGAMIQTWILPASEKSPWQHAKSGNDVMVCGLCKHRRGGGENADCYESPWQAAGQIWRAWQAGRIPRLASPWNNILSGRRVRLGSYGDPCAVPMDILEKITTQSMGWTGYTHAWRRPSAHPARHWLMASVDTDRETDQARRRGWKTYRVKYAGDDLPAGDGAVECDHATNGTQCADCMRCDAHNGHIWQLAHGSLARRHEMRREAATA